MLLVLPGWLFLFLGIAGSPAATKTGAETLLRRVIEHHEIQQEGWHGYSYRERVATRDFREDGSLLRGKSETFLVTPSPDGEYRRLLTRHGRPLSEQREAKEERRFREHLERLRALSPRQRRSRAEEKLASRVEKYRTRLSDAVEVFDFTAQPDEWIDGEPVRVFSFAPKPGYAGDSRSQKMLSRMEGVVWIDARRDQLARLYLRAREDLRFLGGIFGRVSKGSEARAEAFRDGDLWLLDRVEVDLDARFYFLKTYRRHVTIDYGDYREYSLDKALAGSLRGGADTEAEPRYRW